jgi:hypothetical protein
MTRMLSFGLEANGEVDAPSRSTSTGCYYNDSKEGGHMLRTRIVTAFRGIGLLALLLAALPVSADGHSTVRWKVVGVISGQANPFTTAAYWPRPLSAGELVEMTFSINTRTAPYLLSSSYAQYAGAITSAKMSGSDWSIGLQPASNGSLITVTNDDPSYGDSLDLLVNTLPAPGQTWYMIEVGLRNEGIGNPLTSLALPGSPPAISLFPLKYFYVGARRDLPGQSLDGGVYYGYILSIVAEREDD